MMTRAPAANPAAPVCVALRFELILSWRRAATACASSVLPIDRAGARAFNRRDEIASAVAPRASSVSHRLRGDHRRMLGNRGARRRAPPALDGDARLHAIVIAVLVSSLWRCTGRGVPALLHVGIDRRVAVTDRTGRSREGAILDASYVGPSLTTLVWRADGDRWWRPARTILFLVDSLPPDDFRRLRVVLRYGRAPGEAVEAVTSGIEAG